jgi:hypothetical protein
VETSLGWEMGGANERTQRADCLHDKKSEAIKRGRELRRDQADRTGDHVGSKPEGVLSAQVGKV